MYCEWQVLRSGWWSAANSISVSKKKVGGEREKETKEEKETLLSPWGKREQIWNWKWNDKKEGKVRQKEWTPSLFVSRKISVFSSGGIFVVQLICDL